MEQDLVSKTPHGGTGEMARHFGALAALSEGLVQFLQPL